MNKEALEIYNQSFIANFISVREGEEKLGEALKFPNLEDFDGKYVILGIPEDIGPRANMGNEGAQNAWKAFLKSFLNIQANSFIKPKDILLLGHLKIDNNISSIEELRANVSHLDELVYPIIEAIKNYGKTPIIIGGGHNNAYPIIKGCSLAKKQKLNVLNIDPHADLRKMEGRHSGNGFSFAYTNNFLDQYFVLGLHENYNSNYILNSFNQNENFAYLSFDEMLKQNLSIDKTIDTPLHFFKNNQIGLEIDLDSIANFPVSARTPSGISIEELRKTIFELKKRVNFEYIHICEGAPMNKTEELIVGKTLAYLVSDLIKN